MNMIVLVGALFVVSGAGVYWVTVFNGLVALRNDIDKAWSNIDVLLKQRHDELPRLLEVCKGYMAYERETLARITLARSEYQQASSIEQKAEADQTATSALRSVFAVAENYPQLKANQTFLQLETRISALENQIADRREFYNDSVNAFNIRMQQMPDSLVASFMGLRPHRLLTVTEQERTNPAMSLAAAP